MEEFKITHKSRESLEGFGIGNKKNLNQKKS